MQASCRIKYRKRFRTSIPYKLFHLGKKEPRCSFLHFWVYKNINEKELQIKNLQLFVPRPGIEPGWIAPLVFETSASTDSAIWASSSRLNCECKGTNNF